MKTRQLKLAGVLALLAVPAAVSGQLTAPGVGGFGPIPDGTGTGVSGAPAISTATIVGAGSIANVSIDFGQGGLVHTWAGDLTMTLTHPNGTTSMDILRRPGRGSAAGVFGVSTFGYNQDFAGANSYAFSDAGADVFNYPLSTPTPPAVLASGTYRSTSNPAAPGDPSPPAAAYAYTPTSFASTFGGLPAAGVWTLEVRDWGGGDTGSLNGWTLNVTVPEPASLGFVALGVGGLAMRRRRKA